MVRDTATYWVEVNLLHTSWIRRIAERKEQMALSILHTVGAVAWTAIEASWTTMLDWGQRCRIHFGKDSCRRISELGTSRDATAWIWSFGLTTDILV